MAENNSLDLQTSRYVHGGFSEATPFSIEWWEKINFQTDITDTRYTVEKIYEGRLDLIALAFFNEPRYWWIIAQLNNILDPISEIEEGRILNIPTKDRMLKEFLNGKTGGVISKREKEKVFVSTVV